MCDVCCAELRRWSRSFTRTECTLSLLEVILLILFIALLTFVVMHFLACPRKDIDPDMIPPPSGGDSGESSDDEDQRNSTKREESSPTPRPTLGPGVKCTWKPSMKTKAVTRYYEQSSTPKPQQKTSTNFVDSLLPYLSDGEVAEESYAQSVLALVRVRPPQDITFGCILTIVGQRWAVTAASCIEAIEEVDSLDSFVMMEDYGESSYGKTHPVADVLIHPWYEGKNKSYDIVALKSEDSLVKDSKVEVKLPSALDYFLMTIGEKFTILGYGGYRNVDQSPTGRRLRWVSSFALSPAMCGTSLPRRGEWSLRHLSRPHALSHGACGARPLCGGALAARGAACNYCAGTPLLRGATLLGVMSDNPHCGVACEPAHYVSVALVRPWLDAVLGNDGDFVA